MCDLKSGRLVLVKQQDLRVKKSLKVTSIGGQLKGETPD